MSRDPQSDQFDQILREVRALHMVLDTPAPRLLRRDAAAAYLGVGPTWFNKEVRPAIPEIKREGVVLFDKKHLDAWADKHIADSVSAKNLLARTRTT